MTKYNIMKVTALCLVLGFNIMASNAAKIILEATGARESHVSHHRSHAHAKKTVYLKEGERLTFYLCLRENTAMEISNVVFSNDGPIDVVDVQIDNIDIGSFTSGNETLFGKLWNVFRVSGKIGDRLVLTRDWHRLTLDVRKGDGIEIDYIELVVSDDTLTKELLTCNLMCTNSIPQIPFTRNLYMDNATIIQKSYGTECAEEDNVQIPVFLKDVTKYKITASLPQYRSFKNERDPDHTSCPNLGHEYWKFSNIALPHPKPKRISEPSATLDFLFGHEGPCMFQTMEVSFHLKGRSTGFIDADIGSVASIKLRPLTSNVTISVMYQDRNGKLVALVDKVYSPEQTTKQWEIPDFSWKEHVKNSLWINVSGSNSTNLTIEEFRMERRYMKPERVFTIFKSDDIRIEGIEVDFWWRAPESMEVHRQDNKQIFKNVAYFRIARNVPWAKGMAQVFVLYQDGNVRLLQLPPNGLGWIPFGSSVVVGQSNPDEVRPSAPIVRTDLSPTNLTMNLTYADGGTSTLQLKTTATETVLQVSDINFKQDTGNLPFATFRSMYIKDGNSDSDSVLVDGQLVRHVMNGWENLTGQSFMVYRRCESKHLTLSPDIRLDIQQTKPSQHFQNDQSQQWHLFMRWQRLMNL